ncbi:putative transporter [Phocaeicola dorei]|uniref:putative transporter n=1 Tax=Phocaeicola dorei TaxID=357276 RepID=UPI0039B3B6EF
MDFFDNISLWRGIHFWGDDGVALSVLIISLIIASGIMLSKIRIAGISFGIAWILFVAIIFGHFNLNFDGKLLHFLKTFGLILFVYSIGLQVGPGFFSAFRKEGLTLNILAVISILLSVFIAVVFYFTTDIPLTTMVGILSGAVTNTPGLGAAQQTYYDINGVEAPEIATGYAIAYPLGVVGAILSLFALRYLFRINVPQEEADVEKRLGKLREQAVCSVSLEITNESMEGKRIKDVCTLINRRFVISRIRHHKDKHEIRLVNSDTELHLKDKILVITSPADKEAVTAFLGREVQTEWESMDLVTCRILITKPELQGKTLAQLNMRQNFAVSITRITRSGIDFLASSNLYLQMGDYVTVVGAKQDIKKAEKVLGNYVKHLDNPNLLSIFIGIAMGCLLGSIPFVIPGVPQPVKLGLAGGPLIMSILISRFGAQYKIVTYTTASANLIIRELGLSLFLTCVGLEAGNNFMKTIIDGNGLMWIAMGAVITIVPLLIVGYVGRKVYHLNYYTLIGILSGANTNPPALAYSNEQTLSDAPAIGYATVYPLAMFLRILTAQLLVLLIQ